MVHYLIDLLEHCSETKCCDSCFGIKLLKFRGLKLLALCAIKKVAGLKFEASQVCLLLNPMFLLLCYLVDEWCLPLYIVKTGTQGSNYSQLS